MSTIWRSIRSSFRRISLGRCWNLLMSIADVPSVAPLASRLATDCQCRKISRPFVLTTMPVTGGYRSPMATIRSATVPDRLAELVAHGPADRLAQIEHVPPRRCVCGRGPPRPPVTRLRERLPPRGGGDLLSGCRRTRGWRVCRRKYWVRSPLREISSEGGLGLVEMRADTPAGTARTGRSVVRVLARGQRRRPRPRRELKYRPAVASMYQP